jgi:cation/acetate symporter
VDLLGHKEALFPLKNPGIITMPLSFLVGWVVSMLSPEPEAASRYAEVKHRMHVGADADAPSSAGASKPAAAAPVTAPGAQIT